MIASFLYILLFGILIYIGSFSLEKSNKEKKKRFNLLKKAIRFLQFIQVVVTSLLLIDLLIFLANGSFSIIETSIINSDFSSFYNYGQAILVTFSVINNLIYLAITEIVYRMIKRMEVDFHFDENILISLRLISRLFVVFVLISFGASFVQTGLFTFRFDTVFYYALLIVLIKVFEHAVLVQEDSDLSI
jgi:hypothetical protein